MSAATPTRRRATASRWRPAFTGYLLVTPLVVLLAAFVLYPLGRTIYLTFFEYSFLTDERAFVGFSNYADWFSDERMYHSMWISVQYFGIFIIGSTVLGLVLAVLIDRLARKWLAGLYRTLFYLPVALPAAIVFEMWIWIYDPTLGLTARAASLVGLESPNWLGDADLALPALVVVTVWRLFGESMIIFLVGLAAIPRDYYEAARMDGAGETRIAFRIVLPLLMPMIFLVFVIRLKILELIAEPLYVTQGGPVDSTTTYGFESYQLFYQEDQVGYANTWFILFAILTVGSALLAGRAVRRYQN